MEPRDVAPGPIIEPRWLDVDTAAQYLCMSRHALYHRISRRQIPFVRRGRIIRFDRQALDRWMSKGVRNGFEEARRDLVLPEDDQRSAIPRVHRVRGQKVGGAARVRDRARHPRRDSRMEEHDSELRGLVGGVSGDVYASEVGEEP